MRLFQIGFDWGFIDFLIPILSQTLIAPALIRFLKSLISFKVILDIALVTSVSCFSRNAFADRNDGTGSFFGLSVIVLPVLLYHSHSHLHEFPQHNH